ncbi:tetratricopeptide repeat protein [Alloacidobacterium dinghuense]|uniref:Tetratricopeptide repeat protein n=1 Tax=Alloacidobacterium dinghuense TaxID=2763107 RepID=A0A7G8BMA9_9BACT|nr:tetratricopeptide repeat protein [Alloacidobacterium dinghuense]
MDGVAGAQGAPSHQLQEASIHGTVLDSAGRPVGAARVRLEQKGNPDTVATTTSDGAFVFSGIRSGTYQVSAEKSGQHSSVVAAIASPTAQESIQLVLGSSQLSSSPSSEGMAFADKPNFTVAGITDWTAVGGHGSDASLRTSEALARETTTLMPESAGHGTFNTSVMSADKEAEAKLRAALAASPHSFEANHQLGEFCLQAKSYREAIPLLETAYNINPANHDNEFDLALAYKEAGDFSQAREHIQNLFNHEDNAGLHRALGDLDETMGDSLESVREYEQAARLDPSEQNYFAWGSELLLHRAVWPAAEVFKKGSEIHPKSARMLAALGAALFASALYDEAARRLCEASDLNPADPAPYIFLGKIDIAAPSPLPCAETKLKQFLEETPDDARANYYYAMAIWKQQKGTENSQKMQQVESSLTKAVIADPKYGEAYLQLGNLYADERDSDKAISSYIKAIEVDPQLSEAHYRLGVVYERRGESAKAKQEFQLHDEIEKAQSAAIERQRQEVKQFLVVLQGRPTVH